MNQPQLFNFNGQQVRTVTINDEPYFVGKDVAMILGYKDLNRAIKGDNSPKAVEIRKKIYRVLDM